MDFIETLLIPLDYEYWKNLMRAEVSNLFSLFYFFLSLLFCLSQEAVMLVENLLALYDILVYTDCIIRSLDSNNRYIAIGTLNTSGSNISIRSKMYDQYILITEYLYFV